MKQYRAEILSTLTHKGKTRLTIETLQSAIRTNRVITVKDRYGHPIGVVRKMEVKNGKIVCDFVTPEDNHDIVDCDLVPVITLNFHNLMEKVRFGYDVEIHTLCVMEEPSDPGLEKIHEI